MANENNYSYRDKKMMEGKLCEDKTDMDYYYFIIVDDDDDDYYND